MDSGGPGSGEDGSTMEYDGAEGSGELGCEGLGWCCKRADHLPNSGLGKTFEKDARRRHAWSRASDGVGAQESARFAVPSRHGSGSETASEMVVHRHVSLSLPLQIAAEL